MMLMNESSFSFLIIDNEEREGRQIHVSYKFGVLQSIEWTDNFVSLSRRIGEVT